MALLPNPDEIQRVNPNPSGTVASYTSGLQSQADTQMGQQITQMADQEIQRLDTLKADDAETALMRKELELQTEYDKVKGGDVLTPDFHQSSQDAYKQSIQEIEGGLATPSQKARFQQIAKRRAVSFDARRTAYAMGEADKYEGVVYDSRINAISQNATANYSKPDVVAASMLDLESAFSKEMIRKGMTDPAILTTGLKTLRGNFYSGLIDRALTDNDIASANATYAASRSLLSDEQKRSFESRMKPAYDFAEGQKLATEAQGMLMSGKTLQDVEMYVTKNSSSPGAYNAAQTIFTNLQQANAKATAEAEGSVLMMYHTSGSPVQAKTKVLQSQEYARLTPSQQAKAIDYMDTDIQQKKAQTRADVQFGWSQEEHTDAKARKKEENKYKTPEAMAAFSKAITDPNLKEKSRNEIWAMSSTIGPTLVEKVLSEQTTLINQEKPISIDKDILEAAKPADLKKDTKTDKNDAYDGYVKAATLEWQVAHPGKRPTLEEQQAIARSANSEYTVQGSLWGTTTLKAYEKPPEGKRASEAQAKRDIPQKIRQNYFGQQTGFGLI